MQVELGSACIHCCRLYDMAANDVSGCRSSKAAHLPAVIQLQDLQSSTQGKGYTS
jgi:hypothetical protein